MTSAAPAAGEGAAAAGTNKVRVVPTNNQILRQAMICLAVRSRYVTVAEAEGGTKGECVQARSSGGAIAGLAHSRRWCSHG